MLTNKQRTAVLEPQRFDESFQPPSQRYCIAMPCMPAIKEEPEDEVISHGNIIPKSITTVLTNDRPPQVKRIIAFDVTRYCCACRMYHIAVPNGSKLEFDSKNDKRLFMAQPDSSTWLCADCNKIFGEF